MIESLYAKRLKTLSPLSVLSNFNFAGGGSSALFGGANAGAGVAGMQAAGLGAGAGLAAGASGSGGAAGLMVPSLSVAKRMISELQSQVASLQQEKLLDVQRLSRSIAVHKEQQKEQVRRALEAGKQDKEARARLERELAQVTEESARELAMLRSALAAESLAAETARSRSRELSAELDKVRVGLRSFAWRFVRFSYLRFFVDVFCFASRFPRLP